MALSTKFTVFTSTNVVFKMIEFIARMLLLLLLIDSVIGQASDGTTDQKADTSLPSFSSAAYSHSTTLNGSMALVNSNNSFNVVQTTKISDTSFQQDVQGDSPIHQDSQTSLVLDGPHNLDISSQSISNLPISTTESVFAKSSNSTIVQNDINCKNCPYIDKAASPNVTALLGKMAYLTCRVKNLGDKTVSWVRHRDIHLLTIGRYTYTTDQRFRAILQPSSDDNTLMIKYPQHRDSGTYECQVSTTPHLSHYVHLSVVEPVTEVVGGPDLFIDRGSTINLTCTVKFSPEPPSYIIWNHNSNIISYNSPRGGVSVLTEKGETTTSYLLIQQAKPTDSGRYSCNPSNAAAHSINVHVLNGELPDALQTGGQMPQKIPLKLCLFFSLVLIFGMA